jgi:hypothetical protein
VGTPGVFYRNGGFPGRLPPMGTSQILLNYGADDRKYTPYLVPMNLIGIKDSNIYTASPLLYFPFNFKYI